jgi:hypothetical protein
LEKRRGDECVFIPGAAPAWQMDTAGGEGRHRAATGPARPDRVKHRCLFNRKPEGGLHK